MGPRQPILDLRRGLPFLARRGPDSQRVWTSSDGRVSLLHARLSIVDFDGRADQPMTDGSGRVTVAFVGEIYNYREVRGEFGDYPYRTESDTEVLLAAYLGRGVEAFRPLRGMFIVAIVDQRRRRVVLARDPVGKKPLFVGRVGGATLFGCTMTALVAASGGGFRMNPLALGDYAREGWVDPARCLADGFRPVRPGEVIELDWEGREVGSGDCRPEVGEPREASLGATPLEGAAKVIQRAVERRLENNPLPTALLSGGIDSTVVTAKVQAICRERNLPLRVLTLGSLIPWHNDEPYARQAARRLGIDLEILRIPLRRLGERVLAALDAQDEPLGMVAYFTLFELVRAAKAYGRILITGDGGDEVFLGYGKAGDWIRGGGADFKFRSHGRQTVDPRTDQTIPSVARWATFSDPVLPASAQGQTLTSAATKTPFSTAEIPCGPPLPDWMSAWGRRTVTAQLVGHMFAKADRASAEQGVEIRCPLLDWDVMAYARGLSPEELLAQGRMKALLKAQLAGWPEAFLERPKVGFAFNMRYLWGISNYAGLRESVVPEAREAMGDAVPVPLRRRASLWSATDIFWNFDAAWRLLALSRFFERMRWIS